MSYVPDKPIEPSIRWYVSVIFSKNPSLKERAEKAFFEKSLYKDAILLNKINSKILRRVGKAFPFTKEELLEKLPETIEQVIKFEYKLI
jgi:hypothetical protein